MTNYWILLATLGMALIALVFVLLWHRDHKELLYVEHNLADARVENSRLKVDVNEARMQRNTLTRENASLSEDVEKTRALCQTLLTENEVLQKAAEQRTIPTRPLPKRTSVKKGMNE